MPVEEEPLEDTLPPPEELELPEPPPPPVIDPVAPVEEVKPKPIQKPKVEKKIERPPTPRRAPSAAAPTRAGPAAPAGTAPAVRAPVAPPGRHAFRDRQSFPCVHAARRGQRLPRFAIAAHRPHRLSRDVQRHWLLDLLFDLAVRKRRFRRGRQSAWRTLRLGSRARKAGVAFRRPDIQSLTIIPTGKVEKWSIQSQTRLQRR